MEGKGGGKELSAQATGTNIRCLSRAVEATKQYAIDKLNLGSKQPASSSTSNTDLSTLAALNTHLADHSYITGFQPSQSDATVFKTLGSSTPPANFVHLVRWFNHIRSYNAAEIEKFPGVRKTMQELGYGAASSTPAPSESKDADDDDDFELFGEDENDNAEQERLKEERIRMYEEKKKKKEVVIAKSNIILDVKPWDDETDLKAMEQSVRGIILDGLVWGASSLKPIGYGIKKLQIACVVEDDKVCTDDIEERITAMEDTVQSVDVVSFSCLQSSNQIK